MGPTKNCLTCGAVMRRKVRPSGNRESFTKWKNRQYCSFQCRTGRPFTTRSPHPCAQCGTSTKNPTYCSKRCSGDAHAKPGLPDAVKDHRGRQKARRDYELTECARCGTSRDLQRHHNDLNPRNNAPANISILCRPCHTRLHVEIRQGTQLINFENSTHGG